MTTHRFISFPIESFADGLMLIVDPFLSVVWNVSSNSNFLIHIRVETVTRFPVSDTL